MAGRPSNARASTPNTTTQSIFSNFEFDQLSAEERLYLCAARMGDLLLLTDVIEQLAPSAKLNWDCVDYMGRNAFHLAVDSENIDMIETLIEKVNCDSIEEGLLHAISKGLLNIVRLIIDHPKYMMEQAQQLLKVIGRKDAFFRKEEKYQYPPDITPLILAAHKNNHEIIQLFLSRGYTIERPHVIQCGCQDCRSKQQCDSLKRSRSRLHAYKALSSPAFLALSSPDPITESFELRKELIQIAHIEKEFKKEYLELVEQCMAFTCSTLSLCRSTQEMEAILGEASDCRGPLSRLRLAVQYEEKLFVAHPNTQQHLTNLWLGKEMQFLQGWKFWRKLLAAMLCPIIIPFICLIYMVFPNTKISRAMSCPISMFITHTTSHLIFLFLLAVATFGLDGSIYEYHEDSSERSIEEMLSKNFRPARETFGSVVSHTQVAIAFWVIGFMFLECKQVYHSGLLEHFRQYYNIMDYLILACYLASYTLRFVVVYKLHEVDALYNYTRRADDSLRRNNTTEFQKIVNESRDLNNQDNYFMLPSRFQWAWDDPEIVANVLFALANVLSFARTTYLMPSHELLGPLQISLGRMISDIIRFMVLFLLVLLAFMVGMTNLYSYYGYEKTTSAIESKDKPVESFEGLWETVNTLFFSIFGLISLENLEIKAPADINPKQDSTLLVHRVGLILFAIFQVLVTIVLVNMLIAMMSHSFEAIQGDTDVEWKFARTKLWLNFIDEESTLPVPFNIIPTWRSVRDLLCECLQSCDNMDDGVSLYQYDLTKRRENTLLSGLETSGLVFSRSTYTDIIQRIMRRYLFKMERDKIEMQKKEGAAVVTEVTEFSENEEVEEQSTNRPLSQECDTIMEEEEIRLGPPSPSANFYQRLSPANSYRVRVRRGSDQPELAIRRSTRRSLSAPRGRIGSMKNLANPSVATLQMDGVQRSLRLLDARIQELLAQRSESASLKDHINLLQLCMQEGQESVRASLHLLTHSLQQATGLKVKKHDAKPTCSSQVLPVSSEDGKMMTSFGKDSYVTVMPCNDSDSQYRSQPVSTTDTQPDLSPHPSSLNVTGYRSHSSPGLLSTPEVQQETGRRTKMFSSLKRKLSMRQRSHTDQPSHL